MVELSQNLNQYIRILSSALKPVTCSDRKKFANNVIEQIKKDYNQSQWQEVFQIFLQRVNIKLHPYLYECKDQLK